MGIEKLRIRNFKSLRENEIALGSGVNILVGRNNAGKTSVLQAMAVHKYRLFEEPALMLSPPSALIGPDGDEASSEAVFHGVDDVHIASFSRHRDSHFHWREKRPTKSGEEQRNGIVYLSSFRAFGGRFLSNIRREEVGIRGEATALVLSQLKETNETAYEQVSDQLRLLDLGIGQVTVEADGTAPPDLLVESYGFRSKLAYQGAGTLAMIPLVVQLVTSAPGSTIMVEEVESYLNRGTMERLATLLDLHARAGKQVVLTTHSTDFLRAFHKLVSKRAVSQPNLFEISRNHAGVSVANLDISKFTIIKHIIEPGLGNQAA